jgi:hypothetical protein
MQRLGKKHRSFFSRRLFFKDGYSSSMGQLHHNLKEKHVDCCSVNQMAHFQITCFSPIISNLFFSFVSPFKLAEFMVRKTQTKWSVTQ